MNSETFRTRLFKLTQKSRKAFRLYSSMGRRGTSDDEFLSDAQVKEWREVNSDLLQGLTAALELQSNTSLAAGVYALRDRFYHEWRMTESELHKKHKTLILSAENEDFSAVATMAKNLATIKARVQALHAVHQEVQDVISQSHVSQPTISLDEEVVTNHASSSLNEKLQLEEPRQAKVIQMPRRVRV